MSKTMNKKEIVKKLVNQELTPKEREELLDMLVDNPIAVDIDKQERYLQDYPMKIKFIHNFNTIN